MRLNKKGVSIIFAIFTLLVLSILGLVIFSLISGDIENAANRVNLSRGFGIGEGGENFIDLPLPPADSEDDFDACGIVREYNDSNELVKISIFAPQARGSDRRKTIVSFVIEPGVQPEIEIERGVYRVVSGYKKVLLYDNDGRLLREFNAPTHDTNTLEEAYQCRLDILKVAGRRYTVNKR